MPQTVIDGPEGAKQLLDQELGVSEWVTIDQAEIDRFADATGDHQWIHVDPERAAESPLGTTIAHGLFTLSLGPKLGYEIYGVEGFSFGLNYGYEKVRFPAPLPSGSKLRMRATLVGLTEVPGGLQMVVRQQFEAEGIEKPVCVADGVVRLIV